MDAAIHAVLPHNRGEMLWQDQRPTDVLSASIRRWVTTMMHDEGITAPIINDGAPTKATVWAKQGGRLSGISVTDHLMREWMPGANWKWEIGDGATVEAGKVILTIEAGREQLLVTERVILNIIGRLSGITTNTAAWVSAAVPMRVAATRKTHWGILDKWAVHLGGGLTHRLTRADARMVKENDLAAMGRDGEKRPHTVSRVVSELSDTENGSFLVLEVRTIDEAIAAAETWVDRMRDTDKERRMTLMLDNMEADKAKQVILDLETRKFRDLIIVEASGGISKSNLEVWKELGVDVVSASGLHRGTSPLDVSMLLEGA